MWNRASTSNLVLSLVAFLFFMWVVDLAVGFGMGIPELVVWFGALVAGVILIVRRYVQARAETRTPSA
jgi:hypothetical protein